MEETKTATKRLLSVCSREPEQLDIILTCDGVAGVGQVGNQAAIEQTQSHEEALMCCLVEIAVESKPHMDIARRARKLIVINGCANRCAG